MTSSTPRTSDDFPEEATAQLVRIAASFDGALIVIGLGLAAAGWVAGGVEVAVLGLVALVAVGVVRARA